MALFSKIKRLGNIETKAGLQYNRVARITFSDISAAATSFTGQLSTDVPARSLIKGFAHDIITPFTGGAGTNLTIKVGHNGAAVDDDDAYIAATEINSAGTEILCAVGAGANNVGGYMNVEATNIEAVFTATGANTSTLTAGEIEVRWLELPASELRAIYP